MVYPRTPRMRIFGHSTTVTGTAYFLSSRRTAWVQISRENVCHSGFPACKSLHSHFTCIGCRPRFNQTKCTASTLSRAERHRSSSWVTFLCHVGFLLCFVQRIGPTVGGTRALRTGVAVTLRPNPTSRNETIGVLGGWPIVSTLLTFEQPSDLPPV